jgi:UDP-N-acetylmuramyl pentapeptide phosphotransferase/UDP-N-acetylglucosamine-1-phosphate transferase
MQFPVNSLIAGNYPAWPALLVIGVTAGISTLLITLMQPLLRRYALARPNTRSSHKTPTPQGGGIAIVATALGATALARYGIPASVGGGHELTWVFGSAILLAVVGAVDDIRALEAVPRLVFQAVAVAIIVAALPSELRVVPALPWWLERALLLAGGIWFVNLVNFMDGIDWMTVVEVVPLAGALAAFGLLGALPANATLLALALCGAMIGFAPFNRPVARLFLGDVGSLPIGLLLVWLLIRLAENHFAAALLLTLYYLADATITLLRRFARGEPVTQAHRSHFYQHALDNGFTVYQIVGRVFVLNLILASLAAATFADASIGVHLAALLAGCILVGMLLWNFSRGRHSR